MRCLHSSWLKRSSTLSLLLAVFISGDAFSAGPARTAPAPTFTASDVKLFLPDAREKLGPGAPGAVNLAPVAGGSTGGAAGSGPGGGAGNASWPAIISSDAIETEIKNEHKELLANVANLNAFKSGGNTKARYALSMLVSLFKVAEEYPSDVKFKKDAANWVMACASAAGNCKTSSDAAYKEAQLRAEGLKELFNGKSPSDLPKPDPDKKWPDLVNIPPLMQRLETSQKERLSAWAGSKGDFEKNAPALIQEGEVLSLLGKVIAQEGFDNWDAVDYQGWCKQLGEGGKELSEAAKAKDHDRATKAISQINKACTDCHGAYR